MANKKYYWLKLKEDFFEEDAISWIEEQENGKDYCLFYLKLCLKSLKTNGLLIRNVGSMLVPYDIKTLARVTNTETDTVRVAMELFKRIGLVQILENGEIYIAELQNMVGSETKWAEKKRLQRQKKDNVPGLSGQSPIEIEIETETETETEIEIEIEQQHIGKKENIVVDNEIERSLVIVELKKAYNQLGDKDIKKIADTLSAKRENYDLDYLKEKIELSKRQSNIRNLVGFLIKAINKDFTSESISNFDKGNSGRKQNPKVHNFIGSDGYSKYSEEELERMILENQKHKFK
ncbi:phage replisome organizer N-terminal domain-containing protein [Paraclostridium bifermentans]|uniref:phage replisome organizer N-terminal domain-containing protein n=1 Tax=Paraclostridium bifermentans TaxID=1490 RepID=UPI0022E53053|nr:phage replisome organizer N-terminal domain-containing protein [Paraclostridium bifermentans]